MSLRNLRLRWSAFIDGWAEVARMRRVCVEWSREVDRLTADLEFAYEMNARLMTEIAGHAIERET